MRAPTPSFVTTTLHQRSFAVRYLTLFGGETFSKLCVVAAFAYLAHVLTPAEYGTVELALAITIFFVLGVESGMGLYGARVVATHPDRIPSLVPQVMLLRISLGVPAFALMLVVATYSRVAGLGILAINGIAVLLTPFLTQWVFQGLRQMQWVAAGAAARNFVFVALVLLLVRPGSDIRLVAVAEVSGIAVLALFNAYFLHRRLGVRLDWSGLPDGTRRLFGDVWYMGLSDFTWACLWYSPALILGWIGGTEQVAFISVAVRIVMALHTFVWLYFFNMLPNMAKELAAGLDDWRDLIRRSMAFSMWPACLAAVGGTLIAPVLIPSIWGNAYQSAVVPLQIAIWMVPVAWFSGHFRFSLIAAGLQRWEFAASAATAVVTVTAAAFLGHYYGSVGAASALLTGGIANTMLAIAASTRYIGGVDIAGSVRPAVLATGVSLAIGAGVKVIAGPLVGTIVACVVYLILAARLENELVRMLREWRGR
jgi:O-antigen/teichoic acid export membrane protein